MSAARPVLPVDVQGAWSADDVARWLTYRGVAASTVAMLLSCDTNGSCLARLYYDAYHRKVGGWADVGVYRLPSDWAAIEEVYEACHHLEDSSWCLHGFSTVPANCE